MILYNVTVKVDPSVDAKWKQWMKETHIPDMLNTGLIKEYKMCRLLSVDDSDGATYASQFMFTDVASFNRYQKDFAPGLQADHKEKFGDLCLAFRTLMEVLDAN